MKPDFLILDMDGVLWRGDTAVPNLPDFFNTLQEHGRGFMLATNNSSKTPAQYVARLAKFDVEATEQQVMTSALATAAYLAHEYEAENTAVYLIGQDGIRQALQEQGFTVLDRFDLSQQADLVVVGLDKDVVYGDFEAATVHIRRGARFIGTNGDKTFPSELGQVPGNGSLLALISAATDQKPTIIGKPEPIMFQECLRRLGENATTDNTIMVGDRLETDILGGQNAGLRSALVLTGVTRREDLAHSDIQPDFVFDDIHALAAWLSAE